MTTQAIRLRTLTEKSKMGFGKHKDLTVLEVMNLRHTGYLRWVYYNMSMISFHEDILLKLGIGEKWRIAKPGKDAERGKVKESTINAAFCKEVFERKTVDEREYYRSKARTKKNKQIKMLSVKNATKFSKRELQAMNHGR